VLAGAAGESDSARRIKHGRYSTGLLAIEMVQPAVDIWQEAIGAAASSAVQHEPAAAAASESQSTALILYEATSSAGCGPSTTSSHDASSPSADYQPSSTAALLGRSTQQQHQPAQEPQQGVTLAGFLKDSNNNVPWRQSRISRWFRTNHGQPEDDSSSSPRISDRDLESEHRSYHLRELADVRRDDYVKKPSAAEQKTKEPEPEEQKSNDDHLNNQLESLVMDMLKGFSLDSSFIMHGGDADATHTAAEEEAKAAFVDPTPVDPSMKTFEPSEQLPSFLDNNPIRLRCIPSLLTARECKQLCTGEIDSSSEFGPAKVGSLQAPYISSSRQSQIRRLSGNASLEIAKRLSYRLRIRDLTNRLEYAYHVKYAPGDYWKAHYSNYLTERNPRQWTLVIFLNDLDQDEGGELRFPALEGGVQITPRAGWAVIWEHCDSHCDLHPEALVESGVVKGKRSKHVIYLHLHARDFQNVDEEILSVA
jgi:hypothetical protein